ncbi:MAG: hypothetical protein ACTTJH_07665 [Bacteroidales bacterium]
MRKDNIPHKKCNCPDDYWEVIIVQKDDRYDNNDVIYYHCDMCGDDFRVEDFYTGQEVYWSDVSVEEYIEF